LPSKLSKQEALNESFHSSRPKHLKTGNKNICQAKKSKIDNLIERDFSRGPKFSRQEIESMMSDKNFANMYADTDKYKHMELGSQAQVKRQMEVLKDELFKFD